jgi:subtilisin
MTRSRADLRAFLAQAVIICVLAAGALIAGSPSFFSTLAAQAPPERIGEPQVPAAVRRRAERHGRVRVLVELKLPRGRHVPEGQLRATDGVAEQRREIADASSRVLARLAASDRRVLRRYQRVPYIALEVTPAALTALEREPDVVRVVEDEVVFANLADSTSIVQADQAWAAGYDGTGTTIAILDTGVDASHPFLTGKVLDEACFSTTASGTRTTCPNGADQQIGPGAAAPCSLDDCVHGTHVAGIAAGNGASAGQSFSGVAKGARLLAIQVFTEITDVNTCGSLGAPCAGAFASDLIAALEHVQSLALSRNIVAANMSLGGSSFTAPCDTQPYKPAIDNLRSIGVATVIAAGNSGSGNSIASPGCISTAISVGSTDKNDDVSSYSDVAPFLSLFATGRAITSSVPGGGYATFNGTSMATPHVAGAWAVIRQAAPGAGVSLILNALRETGTPIADTRAQGFGTIVPRINIFSAMGTLVPVNHPAPSLTSVTPNRIRAGGNAVTLTLTGTNFDAFSVAHWNGAPQPTSVASTTQLFAQIPPSALVGGTTAQVSVVAPSPGGGTTTSLPVIVDPPPTLSVNATTVPASAQVVVTLANGFGNSGDWLAMASASSSNSSYINFVYVGAGVTSKSWTFTMPSTAGQYEFRLFLNNGYTRAATSPIVTVDPSLNPVPSVTSLSPSTVPAGGGGFTLNVNGSGFVSSSSVRWNGSSRPTTFVSSSQVQAAIGSADIATAGTASITVFSPTPGGGTSSAVTFNVSAPSGLSVNATTFQPGGSVTVTLTNGTGGSTDWLAFAATSAPNTSYLAYTYVGGGVTNRTWTVNAPSTAGTYEFRYFPNGGYTRAATSPPITVQAPVNPTPSLTSLSPTSTAAGSPEFELTVNGNGFVSSSVVRWNGSSRPTTFIGGTQLRATIPASNVAASGSASVTVFTPTPGGGTSSPLAFTITSGPSNPPTLSVPSTNVSAGSSITVTLANGLGGSGDWMSFASTTAPNSSYINFTYVGAGVTTRTWTVTAPNTPGTYEFRLFPNNGYTRAATSPTITVTLGQNPVPSITSLNPGQVTTGSGAFTLTVNGNGFVPASVVRWNGNPRSTTFVSSTQLTASIGASDVAFSGTAQVTVNSPSPGGGTSGTATFVIGAAPTLTVNATSVAPGASVTVTLTNGMGGPWDWLALAAANSPNSSYIVFTYVGGGVTTRTWTVTMPTAPGTYEFRLFPNNSYTRVATSPVVTVTQ